jgi:hypothetical protein
LKKGSNRRPACPNEECGFYAQQDQGNIVLHGFSNVKWGRRRQQPMKEAPCDLHGRRDQANIALHGFSKVKWGRRRRYRCEECGKTAPGVFVLFVVARIGTEKYHGSMESQKCAA